MARSLLTQPNLIAPANINDQKSSMSNELCKVLIFDFYYIRECANAIYQQVAIKNKTAILYNPLTEEKFNKINEILKPKKGLEIIEYRREFKGFKFDVAYWWGFNDYAINYSLPNGKVFHKKFSSCTVKPVLYDKPFGMEFSDFLQAQSGMKYILEEKHINTKEFIIEENENWPHYYMNKEENRLICAPHSLVLSNMTLKDIKKV